MCRRSGGRGTWRSSWTATAAGRSGSICRGSKGIAAAWPASAARSRKRARLHLEQLTLYCLSSENWKRPQRELDFLMHLLEQYMIEERPTIMRQNIDVSVIGRREGIPDRDAGRNGQNDRAERRQHAACGCAWRSTTAAAARSSMPCAASPSEVQRRQLAPAGDRRADRSPTHLYTAGMPDPDLLIRTAGEMRISNFLLWQISYAEMWVTERCWPEFEIADFHQAIRDFAARDRRFGGLQRVNFSL